MLLAFISGKCAESAKEKRGSWNAQTMQLSLKDTNTFLKKKYHSALYSVLFNFSHIRL